jgi:DNA phosphorothioation-associated putative methyltransferase
VKSGINDGLIGPSTPVFDYGCGHGHDIKLLANQGIQSDGWDPAFRPDSPRISADVVNLGFVLNVIEDVAERATALRQAWGLARRLLIVATQVKEAGRGQAQLTFGDGVLTGLGTFQKFFTQGELKAYLETELSAEAIPASLGVFYVFKDETLQQQYLANRYRRRSSTPRKRISEQRFEENRELLEPFMATIAALGRLPEADELPESAELETRFGSFKRAFALVKRVTGPDEWDAITRRCTEDLLVYLALGRFRRRPPISALPLGLQRDIRAFFGSYSNACRLADDLLFRAGERRGRRRSLPVLGRRQTAADRSVRPPHRARGTRPPLARLRGLRPGLSRHARRGQPDQAAPPVRQGFVPRLSRFRD